MKRSLLLALSTISLLLAGCGGDGRLSKAEYEETVRSAYGAVQQAFRETNVDSANELAARVEAAQDQLREAASKLEDVEPPKEVEAENREIAEGMRAYAEDLDRLRNAAERGDVRTIEDINARITQNESVGQIAEAAEEMKFKGYDLGPIAEE
jgi:soluble cytochrome b562